MIDTRDFPRFRESDQSLKEFNAFLQSVDGGKKGSKTAKEVTTDVSKFLRYACGEVPTPVWGRLTNRDQLVGHLSKLECMQ